MKSFLFVALAACHSSLAAGPEPATEAARPTITYATAVACPAHWSDEVSARIAFDESRTSRLGVPLAGRVTRLDVVPGQRVAAGAPLFVVASADLADLRTQRDRARVELATARTNLARVRALVDAQSLPAKELVAAEHDVAQAKLGEQATEEKIAALRLTSGGDSAFTVTAPRAGTVVDLKVTVGQQVSPDAGLLIAIADLSHVWVYANLVDDTRIAVGTPAKVTLEDGSVVAGAVDQVSAVVDPDRHAVPVRVALDNATGALRPGGFADMRFLDPIDGSSCVPPAAVRSDGADHYVYVRAGGAVVRRTVISARADAGLVAIRAGLAPGEEVVATGTAALDNQLADN